MKEKIIIIIGFILLPLVILFFANDLKVSLNCNSTACKYTTSGYFNNNIQTKTFELSDIKSFRTKTERTRRRNRTSRTTYYYVKTTDGEYKLNRKAYYVLQNQHRTPQTNVNYSTNSPLILLVLLTFIGTGIALLFKKA